MKLVKYYGERTLINIELWGDAKASCNGMLFCCVPLQIELKFHICSFEFWILRSNSERVYINGNQGDHPYVRIANKCYLATHINKLLSTTIRRSTTLDENRQCVFCPDLDRDLVDASHLSHTPFCVNPSLVVFAVPAIYQPLVLFICFDTDQRRFFFEPATLNNDRNHYLRRFKYKGLWCFSQLHLQSQYSSHSFHSS